MKPRISGADLQPRRKRRNISRRIQPHFWREKNPLSLCDLERAAHFTQTSHHNTLYLCLCQKSLFHLQQQRLLSKTTPHSAFGANFWAFTVFFFFSSLFFSFFFWTHLTTSQSFQLASCSTAWPKWGKKKSDILQIASMQASLYMMSSCILFSCFALM